MTNDTFFRINLEDLIFAQLKAQINLKEGRLMGFVSLVRRPTPIIVRQSLLRTSYAVFPELPANPEGSRFLCLEDGRLEFQSISLGEYRQLLRCTTPVYAFNLTPAGLKLEGCLMLSGINVKLVRVLHAWRLKQCRRNAEELGFFDVKPQAFIKAG